MSKKDKELAAELAYAEKVLMGEEPASQAMAALCVELLATDHKVHRLRQEICQLSQVADRPSRNLASGTHIHRRGNTGKLCSFCVVTAGGTRVPVHTHTGSPIRYRQALADDTLCVVQDMPTMVPACSL